jgi:hypothetical protein
VYPRNGTGLGGARTLIGAPSCRPLPAASRHTEQRPRLAIAASGRHRSHVRCEVMYAVDSRDLVQPLGGIPRCSAGAPEPVVVADERSVVVAYYAAGNPVDWNTATPEDLGDEEVVLLRFEGVHSMMFGSPNDEALHGHPLADRGLDAYAAHRVLNSSWIRGLERMNRVHPMHSASGFSRLSHFILTFHDSTFECVCSREPEVGVTSGVVPAEAAASHHRAQPD